MKRTLLTFIGALTLIAACNNGPAPSQKEKNVPLTADGLPVGHNKAIYTLYPDPAPEAPAIPDGYEPVYLSHYGRHGSRYMQYDTQYVNIHRMLEKIHDDGKLTPLGEDVRNRFNRVWPDLKGRGGELSSIGVEQHRGIARRMVSNYPGLFRKGSRIVLRSTNLERTMLSMVAFTSMMTELKPGLVLDMDGTHMEMNYLNPHSKDNPLCSEEYSRFRSDKPDWLPEFLKFAKTKIDVEAIAARIISDPQYAAGLDMLSLEHNLYLFSDHIAGIPVEQVDFYDIFTTAELEEISKLEPAITYIQKGKFPDPRAKGTWLCESLLSDFLCKAQSDMEQGVKARLRFGHDGCMFGLFALMDIPGWNQVESDYEKIWGIWDTSAAPMAGNIQMLCCRGRKGEVIVAWLVNETPMVLPLEEVAPGFYKWDDFLSKYTETVARAKALI